MVLACDVKDTKDGVEIKKRAVEKLMSTSNNVFDVKISPKPAGTKTTSSLKASTAIAQQIVRDANLNGLSKIFQEKGMISEVRIDQSSKGDV